MKRIKTKLPNTTKKPRTTNSDEDGLKLSKKDLRVTKIFNEFDEDSNPLIDDLLAEYGY